MPKIEQYKVEDKIVAMFVSRSGRGKSAAAASFPKPFHEFDFDNRFDGIVGACKPPVGYGFIESEGISYDRMFTSKGYEPFEDEITKLELEYRQSGRFKYKSIEIASATTLMQALINSSHKFQSGRKIGKLRMSGPGDFNFEVTGMKQIIEHMHELPCHMILSAHIIDKWGKPKGDDEYAANEIIGEKLLLRDQPGEVLLACFSNVFRFDRELIGNEMQYFVEFQTDIAKNSFGIPPGRFDITNKPFYPFLQELIRSIKDGTFKPPETKRTGLPNFMTNSIKNEGDSNEKA